MTGRTGAARATGTDTHFDVVVVGSGFGGSVTAYRLAEAGLRVCVLERGKAYPPGSFPRSPREMKDNFWDPSEGRHGLFNAWSFRGLEALVSAGLGGGSLIYANVLLRKDEKWFVQRNPHGPGYEEWPITRADLDPHYDVVERMLAPQRFPLGAPGFELAKTRAMQEAAQRLGLEWQLPNLAITFANEAAPPAIGQHIPDGDYPNLHGQSRVTCRLTGECDLGCNNGSKNTLDHNYLSAAKHHGADIRTRCEVRSFEPRNGGGYSVSYVEHRPENEGRKGKSGQLSPVTLTAGRLVLSAGSLGSTFLLLRNRSAFPGISPALGSRFCGNGDLLAFMLRSRTRDTKRGPRVLDGSRGPVITSTIRVPDEVDMDGDVDGNGGGRGYYVQDAGFPGFVDWMLEGTQAPSTVHRLARFALRRLWAMVTHNPKSDLSGELAALVGDGQLSSGSLPLLGMGRDVPDGRMSLRKGYLDLDWTIDTSKEYFDRVADTMRAISDELGASFHINPLWRLKRVITVHPLGGSPMGRHHGDGVVDTYGEVFGYPGLHVADGSVMPGPVGPNPALTIAAFANRMSDAILEGRTSSPPPSSPSPSPSPVPAPAPGPPSDPESTPPTAIEFTEEMKGYVTFGEDDFHRGFEQGRRNDNFLMFHLTIETDDVERFVADPAHLADARGWVECEALGGRLPVERGVFNLFVETSDPDRTNMLYRLFFADGAGHPLTFVGFKDVKDDRGLDLWRDTTTLFTRVLRGHVEPGHDGDAEVVASGIITIHLLDFLEQLTTFRAHGPSTSARAEALGDFGRLFLGKLWDTYAGAVLDAAGAR
ncbi:MAG TPA: FAD-dependent oxidoreductase [Acidimicrobiales bacterium]|nr:FAD-dependent oxidoreductase [Acidimicrobiales bacterium]